MPPKTEPGRGWLRSGIITLFFILFCPLFINIYSQDANETPKQERRRSTKPDLESKIPKEAQSKDKGYTIGVNVDLVLMYTSVFDKNGRFVGGLNKDRFKVFEDGIAQTITSF